MNIKDLKKAIESKSDDLPVFFRRISPICGNIEQAGSAHEDTYGFFGTSLPCLIIEPMSDEEDEEKS